MKPFVRQERDEVRTAKEHNQAKFEEKLIHKDEPLTGVEIAKGVHDMGDYIFIGDRH